MKLISLFVLSLFLAFNADAYTIKMYGKDKYGFDIPQYFDDDLEGDKISFSITPFVVLNLASIIFPIFLPSIIFIISLFCKSDKFITSPIKYMAFNEKNENISFS
jgi:hypothetical protein